MTFTVPASKGELPQNRFGVELPDGSQFTLPKMQFLSADLMGRLAELSSDLRRQIDAGGKLTPAMLQEFQTLYRGVMEDNAPGLYEKLNIEQLTAVITAWTEASTVGMGELSASAD